MTKKGDTRICPGPIKSIVGHLVKSSSLPLPLNGKLILISYRFSYEATYIVLYRFLCEATG